MMKKKSCFCVLIMLVAIAHSDSYCSEPTISWKRAVLLSSFKRLIVGVGKFCAKTYYAYYAQLRGFDLESQKQEARRSGACSIPLSTMVEGPVRIAPDTVPELLKERIKALQRGNYQWPACKPILLVGSPGIGKTQLAKYLAKQSVLPFMPMSSAGFFSSKQDSGVETISQIFKRSRIRSELASWGLRFRKLWAWLWRRPIPCKKPAVVLLDEFDALAQSAGNNLLKGDKILEVERDKAFTRLCWEIAHNPYNTGHLSASRCPPTADDRSALMLGVSSVLDQKCLAEHKKAWPFFWETLGGGRKAETLVVATTNSNVAELDPHVRAWFDIVEIPPLDFAHRRAILDFHAQNKRFENRNRDIDYLAGKTEGCSAAKLASILNNAAILSVIRDGSGVITRTDFDQAHAGLDRLSPEYVSKLKSY